MRCRDFSRCVVYGLSALELDSTSEIVATVIQAVPLHLSSPIGDYMFDSVMNAAHVRQCGMKLAVAMSRVLSPDSPLEFEELGSGEIGHTVSLQTLQIPMKNLLNQLHLLNQSLRIQLVNN